MNNLTDDSNDRLRHLKAEEYIPLYLMNVEAEKGGFKAFIESIPDPEVKELAYGEFYYYTGKHCEAAEILDKYLDHENFSIKAGAWFVSLFCNLDLCRIDEARKEIDTIYQFLKAKHDAVMDEQMKALYVFATNAANALLDLRIEDVPAMGHYLKDMPPGTRVFGCYIMAMQSYLKGEYGRGLGIVETCLSLERPKCTIPVIYLCLAGAMNAMSLDNVELGITYFNKAYELAEPEELFEPIGENHGLLQGLVETCLKKKKKKNYEKIIDITYKFSYGWRRIHNPITSENIADTLTTTEFSVAMLANRGWTNKEIADYMDINVNTVKAHIANVFNKLGISSRKELDKYMLK